MKILFWIVVSSSGATVELMQCAGKRTLEQGESQIPVECMHLFRAEVIPIGVDRPSIDALVKRLIAIGHAEAAARVNPEDPYPPLMQLVMSESEVRTLECLLNVRAGLELDRVPITRDKMLRTLERLRKCGRTLYDLNTAKAA